MTAEVVDQPVFLVGCGRSGTTLLYELLAGHPDLGWFSNYTDRWPQLPQLAALNNAFPLLQRAGKRGKGVPIPSEGYALWDRCSDQPPERREGPLSAADATADERERLVEVISQHLRYQRRPRFLNKNTRNARRVGWLGELLPESRVVHVLRDPRASASSLLQVAFWPALRLHWRGGANVADLVAQGVPGEVLAAELWRDDVTRARSDGAELGDDRYLEVRYEDILAGPQTELSRILRFAGLNRTEKFDGFVDSFSIVDRRDAYRRHLSTEQIRRIDEITKPSAAAAGYPLIGSDTP